MSSDNLKRHLQRIGKYVQQSESNLRITSSIAVKQLRCLADRLMMKERPSQTPTLKKILPCWRDDFFPVVESPASTSYSEYQEVKSNWTTFTKPTGFSGLESEDNEIVENSENESYVSQTPPDFDEIEMEKKDWQMGLQNYDPDLLFNPQKTPQGKGYFCDLSKIFSENGGRLKGKY